MRYPEFLQPGGCIGFVAPSFGCNIEPYQTLFGRAVARFEGMGYTTRKGPNCYAGEGIGISNTPPLCGQELNDMYKGHEADVLLSCGGGELMCEVVPYIDFEGIAQARPKWYMGYSDNTNFTFLSATLSDTAAIYAACAPAFGMDTWHPSLQDAFDLLTGQKRAFTGYPMWERESAKSEEHPTAPYNLTEQTSYTLFCGSERVSALTMEGRLLGGCLDCLGILCGTRFDQVRRFCERYQEDGILWFLESCDLNVMDIRRNMWRLRQAGWFDTVKGFVIGRPLHYGEEMMGLDIIRAVTGVLEDLQLPILLNADLGHLPPMLPFISGGKARISATQDQLHLAYDFT